MVNKTEQPAAVRTNALSHGIYAEDLVLFWEDKGDFVEIHKAMRSELEPVGLAEEEAVLGIAVLHWKKRRLIIGSQLAYRRHPDAAALRKAGERGWAGVEQYLESTSDQLQTIRDSFSSLAVSHASVLKMAYEKLDAMLAKPDFPPVPRRADQLNNGLTKEAQDRQRREQLDALIESLNRVGEGVITPAVKLFEFADLEQSVAERIFRPDIIEKEVRIGALIDRQIEKGLAQLVQLKRYKRMYKKKQVSGPN